MAKKAFEIQGSDLSLGGVNLQAGTNGVVIPGVTQATNFRVDEVEDTDVDQTVQFVQLSIVVDASTYNALSTNASTARYATYTVELDDDDYIDEIEVDGHGSYTQQEKTTNETTDMWAYTGLVDPFTTPFDEFDWLQIPFRPKMRAGEVENIGGGDFSGNYNDLTNKPTIPTDVSDLTDTEGLLGQGGSSTTELAYLELTSSPFIVQPVILGTSVTVTAPAQGQGASVEIIIGEGPVITSINVTSAGTGYAVGQRYRIWFYNIGGNNDDSSIDFEVATVGAGGALLTIINAAFTGVGAANIPDTYSGVGIELRSSMVFDEIGPGLTLTRDRGQALYLSLIHI